MTRVFTEMVRHLLTLWLGSYKSVCHQMNGERRSWLTAFWNWPHITPFTSTLWGELFNQSLKLVSSMRTLNNRLKKKQKQKQKQKTILKQGLWNVHTPKFIQIKWKQIVNLQLTLIFFLYLHCLHSTFHKYKQFASAYRLWSVGIWGRHLLINNSFFFTISQLFYRAEN